MKFDVHFYMASGKRIDCTTSIFINGEGREAKTVSGVKTWFNNQKRLITLTTSAHEEVIINLDRVEYIEIEKN